MTILQFFGRRKITKICGVIFAITAFGFPLYAILGPGNSQNQNPSQIVQIAWNPIPGPMVAGYNLYSGRQSGIYTNKLVLGNVTNTSLSCVPGATYFFAVRARDSLGDESLPSNEATYSLPAIVPTSPLNSLPATSLPFNGNTNVLPLPPVSTARLAIQTKRLPFNGLSSCVTISSTNAIASGWALEASEDFKHWRTLLVGSNSLVNTTVISAGCSALFFRLRGL